MKEFEPLSEYLGNRSKGNVISRKRVIKSPNINSEKRITVEVPTDNIDHSGSEVQPIYEDGEIVGIMHRCSCGRIAEIRFNYESR